MKKQSFMLILGAVLMLVGIAAALHINAQVQSRGDSGDPSAGPGILAGEYRLSGPYTYKNLSIFLVHSKTVTEKTNFLLPLQEALEQKKVVVYETKEVNELAIENLSNEDVYIQAGDIVKGGQQDRMLGVDLIVPPRSGRLPIAAFCVEHGRWTQRGEERSEVFSSAAGMVATKDLKLAAKRQNSQSAVWENVTVAQDKLSENVGTRVNSAVSQSSLQLAVENRKVQQTAEGYINALSSIMTGKDDVIGYVFFINSLVNSADVYASSALFRKMWPKLLKANAIEAITELKTDGQFEPATTEAVETFLSESERGRVEEKEVTERVKLVTRENEKHIFFETRDRKQKDRWIHRNYIKK